MLIILTALLLTIPYYSPAIYSSAWISFIPFFYYLYRFKVKSLNYRKVFLSGWALGFLILSFSANFLYHSIKLYTSASFLVIILLLAVLFALLSLIYGFFILLYFYLQRQIFAENRFSPLLFAALWTLLEFCRHHLLFFFPIGNIAYTQSEFIEFIQFAEYGGVWILIFILVYVSGLLFQLLFQRKYKNMIIIALIFTLIFSFGTYKKNLYSGADSGKKAEIGIITSNISQKNKWSSQYLEKNIDLLINAAPKLNETQLVIAPETNLTFDLKGDEYYREKLLSRIKQKLTAPVQLGSPAVDKNSKDRFNSSFLISSNAEVIARYNKNLLLYFGERFPYENFINKITPYNFSSLRAGKENKIFNYNNLSWKTVICSEIFYPEYVSTEAHSIDFIVNQTNEAWFKNSRLLKNIMWQAAVMRAVENRTPVIKTGNQAHNGIIYAAGDYIKVNPKKNYHKLNLKRPGAE